MASNRWDLGHGRRWIAIGLAFLGLFVLSFGVGSGNAGLLAVGLAIGVLGPAFLVVSAVRANTREYIYGTAHVHAASPPPSFGAVGRAELHLSVFAHGIEGVAVRVLDPAVPVAKWPDDGATLPVEVAAHNPRKVRVLWDKVVTHAQAAGEELYPEYVDDPTGDSDEYEHGAYPPEPDEDATLHDLPPVPPGPAAPEEAVEPVEEPVEPIEPVVVPVGVSTVDTEDTVDTVDTEPPPVKRKPSPRPRRPPEEASAVGFAITPVYVGGEAPKPPPDWPLSSEQEAPQRPESRPEPIDIDVVAGTVQPGQAGRREWRFGWGRHARRDDARQQHELPEPITGTIVEDPRPAIPVPAGPMDTQEPRDPAFADVADVADVEEPEPEPQPEPQPDAVAEPTTAEPTTAEPTTAEPTTADDEAAPEPAPILSAPQAGLSQVSSVGGFSVTLFVRELARSVAFYRDMLGLAEVDTGPGSAVLARGEARIVLKRVTDLKPVDRRIVHLNLEVPDVQAAYQELRARGVDFVHKPRVVSHGEQLELWAATFRDPDGHAIALTRWELRR